jgi:hypothetical protein
VVKILREKIVLMHPIEKEAQELNINNLHMPAVYSQVSLHLLEL